MCFYFLVYIFFNNRGIRIHNVEQLLICCPSIFMLHNKPWLISTMVKSFTHQKLITLIFIVIYKDCHAWLPEEEDSTRFPNVSDILLGMTPPKSSVGEWFPDLIIIHVPKRLQLCRQRRQSGRHHCRRRLDYRVILLNVFFFLLLLLLLLTFSPGFSP